MTVFTRFYSLTGGSSHSSDVLAALEFLKTPTSPYPRGFLNCNTGKKKLFLYPRQESDLAEYHTFLSSVDLRPFGKTLPFKPARQKHNQMPERATL